MADEDVEVGETTLVERPHPGALPWWLAAAAVVFLALWGWRELDVRRMRELVESEMAEVRQLSEENQQLNQRLDRMLAEVASPKTRTFMLSSADKSMRGSAKVFIDPTAGRAIVVVSDLRPGGVSKDYQLWITRANADKPVSAVVFDVPPSGGTTLTIDNVPPPEEIRSFGVTLEQRGGAEMPTGAFVLSGRP